MSPAEFREWRRLMQLNKTAAATALGLSRNMPWKYEKGIVPVPLSVALACGALIRGHGPWPE